MLYFIPAWYRNDQWCENEQCWQERRMQTEFDDTVKQIQLFHRNKPNPYRILLLSYAPNFRHFLHRQSVYHAPYWSCFDAIQEIHRDKAVTFSFHNLTWPEDIEFIYSPFVVVAMLKGEKYAQIEFGEDGNMIRIEMYKGDRICRRNIYDDRGFVSATILYEEGEPVYQDYLMESGEWKLRHFLKDDHVEINPKYPNYEIATLSRRVRKKFTHLRYESIEQVIEEVFASYVRYTRDSDAFCIAMHGLHTRLVKNVLMATRTTILSFYMDRYNPEEHPETLQMLRRASYIITDSKEATERIAGMGDWIWTKVKDISPYDSRVDFGISQQMNVQNILVPVDGLTDNIFSQLIVCLGNYLMTNDNARVHLLTRIADYDRPRHLLQQTKECLRAAGMQEEWVAEDHRTGYAENGVDTETPVLFYVEQCVDELSVSRCMREQRIIVEMREVPELFLQITAISMGIPQIVYTRTQFVEDGKNGIVVQDISKLPQALAFYLDGLANWNQAMVASYEIGKRFTTDVLIEKWKEVLEFIGADSYTTAWK